jgi:hypothetical protein
MQRCKREKRQKKVYVSKCISFRFLNKIKPATRRQKDKTTWRTEEENKNIEREKTKYSKCNDIQEARTDQT